MGVDAKVWEEVFGSVPRVATADKPGKTHRRNGGTRRGTRGKKGDPEHTGEPAELEPKAFTDEEEARTDAALIQISQDAEHPQQCVAAARLLKEFKRGRPHAMTANTGADRYRAFLESLARCVDQTG